MRKTVLAGLGAITWFAIVLQWWQVITIVGPEKGLGMWESTGWYFSYMTLLTNVWVALMCTALVLAPRSGIVRWMSRHDVQAALLVYILAVGMVYHMLLTDVWDPAGWMKVADVLMHTLIPLMYLLQWTFFAPKARIRPGLVPIWLIYPVAYVVMAMLYGRATGRYPYPFLEVHAVGWRSVLGTCAVILLGYTLLSFVVVVVNGRMIAGRDR